MSLRFARFSSNNYERKYKLKKKKFTLERASRKCRIWSDIRGGPFVIKVVRKIE